jgi:quinol monooxygenase YgiN
LLHAVLDVLIPEALAEPGVSVFRVHEDRDQAGHFMLYGRFLDKGSVEPNFDTEHFVTISKALAELAEGGKPKIAYYKMLADCHWVDCPT